ncbi:hypothetical protein JTE90_019353 [Oedothorax gibbosus]|uniref:Uncharacterized protein n=1 Tax=Oedothorax gibbosus TaxID=931172 RepID=A0AAV6UKV2_9ARAC|nr:hypothetical protein JTE90_019353 [Oedothorax gibbosus]
MKPYHCIDLFESVVATIYQSPLDQTQHGKFIKMHYQIKMKLLGLNNAVQKAKRVAANFAVAKVTSLKEKIDMESHIRIAVFLLVVVVLDFAVALQVESSKESQDEIARAIIVAPLKCGKEGAPCNSGAECCPYHVCHLRLLKCYEHKLIG